MKVRLLKRKSPDKTMKKLRKLAGSNGRVKVGFPEGKADDKIIDRAVWNEFGTKTIPPRPFMRFAMENGVGDFKREAKIQARRVLAGETTMNGALSRIGLNGVDHIQESIKGLRSPANAQSTIEQKGSDNPLIDTGEMRQSVTFEVQ